MSLCSNAFVQHDGIAVFGRISLSNVTWVWNHICCVDETARIEGTFGENILFNFV
jgi:hypothetical protein